LIKSLQTRLKAESDAGKHAQYQALPVAISRLLGGDCHLPSSRYEAQRLAFILRHTRMQDKTVIDIGCNRGFFTFSALNAGASKAICFEGTAAHAEFVKECGKLLGVQTRLDVHARYFTFTEEQIHADVIILLNVLHHLGDDYGNPALNIEQAKKEMIHHLNSLHGTGRTLIFQLGFNWRGDRHLPLFEKGTKTELIDFIAENTQHLWHISQIGIAVRDEEGNIIYQPLNTDNLQRSDKLGEFLNRPLFIMQAR